MNFSTFTLVPQLNRSHWCVDFTQTVPGKIALILIFTTLLFFTGFGHIPMAALFVAAITFLPRYRRYILVTASLSYLAIGFTPFHWQAITKELPLFITSTASESLIPKFFCAVAVILFCWGWSAASRKRDNGFYLRRPILTLICVFLVLLIALSYLPLPEFFVASGWVFLVILSRYFWFLCYSLRLAKAPKQPPFLLQIGHYLPFWSSIEIIPYGKGAAYLKQTEANTAETLARTQLSGLKLLIWACYLNLFASSLHLLAYGWVTESHELLSLRLANGSLLLLLKNQLLWGSEIPISSLAIAEYKTAFSAVLMNNPLNTSQNWTSLTLHFYFTVLNLCVVTHTFVAVIRMCGYNVLRNCYRPLTSISIAEFYNRLFYYFKELLVEFFFYPAFFRYFKKHPKLRLYFATMSAAFFGNFLFHFMLDIPFTVNHGFFASLWHYQSYFFYTFVLGNAIFISQSLHQRFGHHFQTGAPRVISTLWVLFFFTVMSIFVETEPFLDNVNYFLHLFNLK